MKITLKRFMDLLMKVGIPLLAVYFLCMVAYPVLQGGWSHALSVWHSWQTLNVGVLAFLSSLIAFNISRYNAEEQRKRELIAATSSLSQALSTLCSYLTDCADVLTRAWDQTMNNGTFSPKSFQVFSEPSRYSVKEIFSECIRHGDTELANHLAMILSKVQINNARILDLSPNSSQHSSMTIRRETIKARLYDSAELQALVNATFPYARQQEDFIKPKIGLEEFNNAYIGLKLKLDIVDGMREYTMSRLENENGE